VTTCRPFALGSNCGGRLRDALNVRSPSERLQGTQSQFTSVTGFRPNPGDHAEALEDPSCRRLPDVDRCAAVLSVGIAVPAQLDIRPDLFGATNALSIVRGLVDAAHECNGGLKEECLSKN